jgi:hypothetical protein
MNIAEESNAFKMFFTHELVQINAHATNLFAEEAHNLGAFRFQPNLG